VLADRDERRWRLRTDRPGRRSAKLDGGSAWGTSTAAHRPEQDKRIAAEGESTGTFSGGGSVALGSPGAPSSEYSERARLCAKEAAVGEVSTVACPSI
jgi:hypothetical protein